MRTLGIIAPYFEGLYSGAIISALYRMAVRDGLSVVVVRAGSQACRYDLDVALAAADAWVCIINPASESLLERACALPRPVCVIAHNYGLEEVGLVQTDNRAGIHAAMQRLYDLGHRRFAFAGSLEMNDKATSDRLALAVIAVVVVGGGLILLRCAKRYRDQRGRRLGDPAVD